MGYTRYWNRTEKKITIDFLLEVMEVIRDCNDKGINIRNGFGYGNPIVTLDLIALNGDRNNDLDHETLFFDNKETGFNFCKTARKPYDYAVRKILEIAENEGLITNVRSDGKEETIISDKSYIEKSGRKYIGYTE